MNRSQGSENIDNFTESDVKNASLPGEQNIADGIECENLEVNFELLQKVFAEAGKYEGVKGEKRRGSLNVASTDNEILELIAAECDESVSRLATIGIEHELRRGVEHVRQGETVKLTLSFTEEAKALIAEEANRLGITEARLKRFLLHRFTQRAVLTRTDGIVLPTPPPELSIEQAKDILADNWKQYRPREGIINYLKAEDGMGPLVKRGLLTRKLLRRLSPKAEAVLAAYLSRGGSLKEHGLDVPTQSDLRRRGLTPEVVKLAQSIVNAVNYDKQSSQKAHLEVS
ncbi:MAG: hypothetical protein AAFX04_13220 [Pseudomonadota bacterium]